MRGSLPEFVDPLRLARQRASMTGAIPVAAMTRIAAIMRDDSGAVDVALRFCPSTSGVPRLDGSVHLLAFLVCQRCLEPIDLELVPELKVSFTGGDEASGKAELADGYEPLDCNGPIRLTTIVEDEILLALPAFPTHLPGTCTPTGEIGAGGPESSPFSGLRAQLEQSRT